MTGHERPQHNMRTSCLSLHYIFIYIHNIYIFRYIRTLFTSFMLRHTSFTFFEDVSHHNSTAKVRIKDRKQALLHRTLLLFRHRVRPLYLCVPRYLLYLGISLCVCCRCVTCCCLTAAGGGGGSRVWCSTTAWTSLAPAWSAAPSSSPP